VISGFSFIHNAFHAGYPIREAIAAVRPYVDEMVVVDAESNDGTLEWLQGSNLVDRVIQAKWGYNAGETLTRLHAMNVECKGDVIVHFEADEVYDDELINNCLNLIESGYKSQTVWRLQIEQNFQRVRWYPELVHRIFPKGSVIKQGHTTSEHHEALEDMDIDGFLWDVTNCFRDNYHARKKQQSELWHGLENSLNVPLHVSHDIDDPVNLDDPHWTWTTTPLNIPEILKPLVGKNKYE